MINGQDRPKSPARDTEPVRAAAPIRRGTAEAPGTAEAAPRRPSGPTEAGAGRPTDGKPPAGEPGKPRRRRMHPALRGLLWTLRLTIVPLLCIAALIAGLYVGYTKIGGGSAADVWKLETWLHMFDLIFADS
ncbi:MAG: hypothetical protein A9Z00_11895 [Thermobacillus sp. ZCTH02-B1]|uniref:DNA-directed RNA polymerase subunit beta n=1 Tax=Thermobacillus sp. ZCTH02-B1 TaxID=1858795 RepID=UPI000B581204|nr:DNA-directed RNA polymerase subunit beta [Thermobacillus sp. ZCTH02-B1]OUM94946.1 MAG: hypothetical protein A9Z00_11895 [Thermobacillus sp. ZCTH02-B1]